MCNQIHWLAGRMDYKTIALYKFELEAVDYATRSNPSQLVIHNRFKSQL